MLSANGLLVIKRLDNKSVILLTNYLSAKATQQIDWRVKGSKEKTKVSCPSVVPEYNQFMGGVKLCDQMKLEYKVDRRIKFCFYLRVFFEFFDIIISRLIQHDCYQQWISDAVLHKRRFSIFPNRKRAISTSRPTKQLIGESIGIVNHLPDYSISWSWARCALCAKQKIENRTYVCCVSCNRSLCLQKERNCFKNFHKKRNISSNILELQTDTYKDPHSA